MDNVVRIITNWFTMEAHGVVAVVSITVMVVAITFSLSIKYQAKRRA